MADYFTHFSFTLERVTAEEAAWALAEVAKAENPEDPEEIEPLGFDLIDEPRPGGRLLWIRSGDGGEGSGNPANAAYFVQQFLKRWRPEEAASFNWCNSCSKPRLDAYSGGAFIITARKIRALYTSVWADRQLAALQKKHPDLQIATNR